MKYTLITGAAGFIGLNYLKINTDTKFIILDALTYAANKKELDEIVLNNDNYIFIHGNICDRKLVYSIFEKYDIEYVINFAAESHVDNSIIDSTLFYESNVLGVQVLLDACRKYNVVRFHQVSSDEVYGDIPLESNESIDEKHILKPSNPYSASKAAADLLALSYHRTYGIDVTISRCSNNFGLYQNIEKLIPKVVYLAVNDLPIPVYGNGLNVRDWIYVEDHCIAIELIINKGVGGEIYNISTNNPLSNIELVKQILKILNKPESLITYVEDRKGHDLKYLLNANKIESKLGFVSNTKFNEKLIETVNYYKNKYLKRL